MSVDIAAMRERAKTASAEELRGMVDSLLNELGQVALDALLKPMAQPVIVPQPYPVLIPHPQPRLEPNKPWLYEPYWHKPFTITCKAG